MSRGYDGKRPHYKLQFRIASILSPDGISHAVERTKFLPDANSFVDSTIQIVRPRESIAATQPKLQPAF
jgi:hypothetical protein